MANDITVSFAGDSAQLEKTTDRVAKAFDNVGDHAKNMKSDSAKSFDDTGNSVGKLGDKADGAETSLIGVHDIIDGTATIMKGPGEAGLVGYIQGWADLAGGVAPVLGQLSNLSIAMVKNAATAVVSAARTVGSWIVMGATAMANAVTIAAAWVISLGPAALVVAAIVLVVGAFVLLWNKSKAFRDFWKGVWGAIKSAAGAAKDWIVDKVGALVGFVKGLPGRIGSAARGMWDGIKNAFRSALNWIIDKWNGLRFGIPSIDTHIPGIGRIGGGSFGVPHIPRFHTGGIVPGAPGSETLAVLQAGERVTAAGQANVVQLHLSGSGTFATMFLEAVRKKQINLTANGAPVTVHG